MTISLISQDGLKAINYDKIQFFTIQLEKHAADTVDTFSLYAKTPVVNGNFFDYLLLFEHEDISVVKHVMRFLAVGDFTIPEGEPKLIIVDLPNLYRYGMKICTSGSNQLNVDKTEKAETTE